VERVLSVAHRELSTKPTQSRRQNPIEKVSRLGSETIDSRRTAQGAGQEGEAAAPGSKYPLGAGPVGAENFIRGPLAGLSSRRADGNNPGGVGAENVIRWAHAASLYSWMRPPSRSDLRTCLASGHEVDDAGTFESGAAWSRDRCGL
jgi:hypothetical protein